jgi:hypothetical protein
MLIRASVGSKVRHGTVLPSMLAMLGAVFSSPSRADATNSQPISQVLYSGTADYLFFIGTGSWVAAGCNAYYVQVLPNLLGKAKIMAIALAAYASGKNVQFQGTCDSQAGYLTPHT